MTAYWHIPAALAAGHGVRLLKWTGRAGDVVGELFVTPLQPFSLMSHRAGTTRRTE
jgi:hypothetical protein